MGMEGLSVVGLLLLWQRQRAWATSVQSFPLVAAASEGGAMLSVNGVQQQGVSGLAAKVWLWVFISGATTARRLGLQAACQRSRITFQAALGVRPFIESKPTWVC